MRLVQTNDDTELVLAGKVLHELLISRKLHAPVDLGQKRTNRDFALQGRTLALCGVELLVLGEQRSEFLLLRTVVLKIGKATSKFL